MHSVGSVLLVAAGAFTLLAALAHLACILIGAPAYRLLGAGERVARAAEAGRRMPMLVTAGIAAVLITWAVYAFSAAGVLGMLPGACWVLSVVSVVFVLRAFAFPLLRPAFPENSAMFWWVSSGICLVLGLLYAVGTALVFAWG